MSKISRMMNKIKKMRKVHHKKKVSLK